MHTIVNRDGWVALLAATLLVVGVILGPVPTSQPSVFNSLMME